MKSLLSRSCKDDRGASVEVLSHAAAGHWVVSGDARIEGMMYRAAHPKGDRGAWDWIGLGLITATGIGLVILLKMLFPGGPGWMLQLAFFAAALGTAWVLARVWAARNASRLVAVVLEEGLCPSCGYNMHGLSSAEDGCAQCPECGAAWSVKRIVRSEPIATGAVFGDPVLTVGKTATRMITDSYDTTDARGKPVRIADVAKLREMAKRGHDAQTKERLVALRRSVMRRTAWVRWGVVAAFAGIAAAAWSMGGPAVLIVMPLCFSVGFVLGQFGVSMSTARDTLLNEGACPACGEDLRDMKADADWVTECPRCRASWRVTTSASDRSGP